MALSMWLVKLEANMNNDILLQTAAIRFLSNLCLKQNIGQVYFIVYFMRMGFLELQGAEARITK